MLKAIVFAYESVRPTGDFKSSEKSAVEISAAESPRSLNFLENMNHGSRICREVKSGVVTRRGYVCYPWGLLDYEIYLMTQVNTQAGGKERRGKSVGGGETR